MINASKIYEAHIHTVHLSNDPLILEFMNEIFPLIQEHIELDEMQEHKAALLEADGQLQWDDIQVIFKAAQKASNGGVLDKAVGVGKEKLAGAKDKIASTVKSKLSAMVDKYNTQAPMKNATVKVDKLKKRAKEALSQSKDTGTTKLVGQVDKIAAYASQNPKVANMVIAVLTTAVSFSKGSAASFAVGMVLDAGLQKLKSQMGEREAEKAKSHEIDPNIETLHKTYNKAFSNATRLISPKKRSKVERAIEKMYKYGQSDADKAKKVANLMSAIASASSSGDIISTLNKSRNIQATNESLVRILWRV